MLLCYKLLSASFIMQQKHQVARPWFRELDTKVLWNHLRSNWKIKEYTSYESYMSVLECFGIGDFLVGDPSKRFVFSLQIKQA